jgi:hypothetical protein
LRACEFEPNLQAVLTGFFGNAWSNFNWERKMSVFGKIMSAIFGTTADAAPKPIDSSSPSPTAATDSPPAATAGSSNAPSMSPATVDVADILDKAATKTGEKLEWRTSIVDLMKALGLDSSLVARKELAAELKYSGDPNDSAKMNVWLHQQMMKNLAANGGKLPADIKW